MTRERPQDLSHFWTSSSLDVATRLFVMKTMSLLPGEEKALPLGNPPHPAERAIDEGKPDCEANVVAAFLVGLNPEWPHGRCAVGDVALWHCWRRFFQCLEEDTDTSSSLAQFVSEHDVTTVEALEERLISFLECLNAMRRSSSSKPRAIHLLFYLGGHGEPGYFCLPKEVTPTQRRSATPTAAPARWCHAEMVHLLDRFLTAKGDHVWMLVDTCYSGSFADVFPAPTISDDPHTVPGRHQGKSASPSLRSLSYSILMSTARDAPAGPDWTLTEAWIQAMEGRLVHPVTGQSATTTRNVVDAIRVLIRRNKQNEMQYRSIGPHDFSSAPFPFCFRHSCRDAKIDPCDRSHNSHSVPPCDVESITSRLAGFHMEGHSVIRNPMLSPQQMAHCLLARNGQYRDYATYPTGTKLWILWEDHTRLYAAKVLEDSDMPWESFFKLPPSDENVTTTPPQVELPLPEMSGPLGPCIPVLWLKEQTYSFMPVHHCVKMMPKRFPYRRRPPNVRSVREQARHAEREEFRRVVSLTSRLPMYCLFRSFESAGKSLCFRWEDIRKEVPWTAASVGTEQWQFRWDSRAMESWNPHLSLNASRTDGAPESKWMNIRLTSSIQSIYDLEMEVFISHLNYPDSGSYCIISRSIDTESLQASVIQMCVPLSYLRRVGTLAADSD